MAKGNIKPTAQKPGAVFTYEVLDDIRHDGDDYKVGDTIDLSERDAEQLVALGCVAVQKVAE